MEFLEGKNLNQTVRTEGPFAPERALPVLIAVCGALDEAHKQGIIHRDLKPENIFLCQQAGLKDYAKVLDFGLAKVTEREMRPGSVILTQEGMVFGTPEFMSPEQAQGKTLTPGSDIYSLAVILYEVLTGKLPFEAKTAMEYIQAHVTTAPIPIEQRAGKAFPPLLWPVISRALEKRPEDRYASAAEFAIAMQAVLQGATQLPPSVTPPAPPIQVPISVTPASAPVQTPQAPLAANGAGSGRDPMATRPDRGRQPGSAQQLAAPAGPSMGLLVGVAAACLILGVVITVVAMKVFVR
jgi:serine/threonine-protein kinase